MTRYLVDTTAIIDLSKGREPAVSQIRRWVEDGDELAVCSIQVAEFCRGTRPADRGVWDEFFGSLTYLDISQSAARRAGIISYELDRRGRLLPLTDTLIAAAALEEDIPVVTNNVRHYEAIEGVRLVRLAPGASPAIDARDA